MKKLFIFTIMLTTSLIYAEEITMKEAIVKGLENNFSIRIAKNEALKAERDVAKGTAGFLPVLDLNGSYGKTLSDVETNALTGTGDTGLRNYSASISMNWTLFDGFKMFADKRKFEELSALGEEKARGVIEGKTIEIASAYLNLVKEQKLLSISEETLHLSEERYNRELTRYEIGGSSSTDLLNSKVYLNNDKSQHLSAKLRVSSAVKALDLSMGIDPSTPLRAVEEITVPEINPELEELYTLGEEYNSSIKTAEYSLSIAEETYQSGKSAFYPKVRLSSGYSYGDSEFSSRSTPWFSDIDTERYDKSISLNVSMNLFNGRRDSIDLMNSKLNIRNSEFELNDITNRTRAQIAEAFESYNTWIELLKVEEENLVTTKRNLDLYEELFKTGAQSSIEYREAQIQVFKAESQQINAQVQSFLSALKIDQHTGQLNLE